MARPRARAAIGVGSAAALATMTAIGPLAHGATDTQRPAALGHGYYTVTSGSDTFKRQFSFNAVTQDDGTVTGNAEVHNPSFPFTAHIVVSCLKVSGNQADVGGTVTQSNDPGLPPGTSAFWSVTDNGEPGSSTASGSDTISAVYFDDVVPPSSCQFIGPNDFDQTPIEGGNIQVQPTGS